MYGAHSFLIASSRSINRCARFIWAIIPQLELPPVIKYTVSMCSESYKNNLEKTNTYHI